MLRPRDVASARALIAPHIVRTPCVRSSWLSRVTGHDVWLKLESLQPTHSFKVRGAVHAVARRAAVAPRGFVTASAGNHGAALAYAARAAGVPVTVFAPSTAPGTKRDKIRGLGARLIDTCANYDDAEHAAVAHAAETGAVFVSPYNDPDVVCGQGTMALEILEDVARCDAIVVPVGGGGLASGVALAVAGVQPRVDVFGIEPAVNPAFTEALRAGAITTIPVVDTVADGLGGNMQEGSITFGLVRDFGVAISLAPEDAIAHAIGDLAAHEHLLAEGAAATAVAGLLGGAVPGTGRTVVVVLTGANIDLARLRQVIDARGSA